MLFYVLDIQEILQDNHVTNEMRQTAPNNDIQEDSVVRKYYNILTIFVILYSIPPPPPHQFRNLCLKCLLNSFINFFHDKYYFCTCFCYIFPSCKSAALYGDQQRVFNDYYYHNQLLHQ